MSEPTDLDATETTTDAAQEDTDAILSRRRFLIQSGLASAGLAVGGCDKPNKPNKAGKAGKADGGAMGPTRKPGICLSEPKPVPDAAASRPCLSVPEMDPGRAPGAGMKPRVCLKVRNPRTKPTGRPCLSVPPPKRPMKPRKALVCLSRPKRPRKRPRKRPMRARICLSDIDY